MKKITRLIICLLSSVLIIFNLNSMQAFARDINYKFSEIDLKIKVPDHLICFTQTTTGNNAHLKDIGADNANEVQASLKAADIYLEAIDEDNTYEIVVIGMKANDSLEDFDTLDDSKLKDLFDNYIENEINKSDDELIEDMTASSIKTINDIPYFYTEVTSVSADKKTMYSKKYYTVKRGYIYIYSLQANDTEITSDMDKDIDSIISSSKYTYVKKSITENGIFTETLSTILTAALPIAILLFVYFMITKFGKKSREKLLKEEAELRAQYKNKK